MKMPSLAKYGPPSQASQRSQMRHAAAPISGRLTGPWISRGRIQIREAFRDRPFFFWASDSHGADGGEHGSGVVRRVNCPSSIHQKQIGMTKVIAPYGPTSVTSTRRNITVCYMPPLSILLIRPGYKTQVPRRKMRRCDRRPLRPIRRQ